ncbi:unnamed protein product [Vitrella brassicaformis CCMP3155]|uniref:RxLR effector protein n=2 Tax=Vitrella brassicaformis TaxID=1169539 RepID=A0A0G4FH69_VITBC|nr:unnamed protein product [Vitrella brassicaformis CCMP3155]|mmetsp:Transcript_8463/g.20789  ORF Transcript_8463/g.20789 Transcript_8463/m.20789 type:complete len:166 (+) Transcript_8463:45-542(+)|eukprot:CEM12636.1 unnamed protein product [Vitrella brassicaformis CCMP3155]
MGANAAVVSFVCILLCTAASAARPHAPPAHDVSGGQTPGSSIEAVPNGAIRSTPRGLDAAVVGAYEEGEKEAEAASEGTDTDEEPSKILSAMPRSTSVFGGFVPAGTDDGAIESRIAAAAPAVEAVEEELEPEEEEGGVVNGLDIEDPSRMSSRPPSHRSDGRRR